MKMPYLARILIYPIKALDGVAVKQAKVMTGGALEHDREFAMFDARNRFVNAKRNVKVHELRTKFDGSFEKVAIQAGEAEHVFHLHRERSQMETWLSEYLGLSVHLQQNSQQGFPDDTEAFGPTVISTETIAQVASWFPGVGVEEMRSRLRANIEIEGVPAFWEDRLFAADSNASIWFKISDVLLEGVNPCQRCVVPTRNSLTGEAYPDFQKIFAAKRKETLPEWVAASRFKHFYRVSVNTRIPRSEAGKILQVGDEVQILEVN
ncbi:MAG: MOSC domain-containing protein [Hormoscilla sp.]